MIFADFWPYLTQKSRYDHETLRKSSEHCCELIYSEAFLQAYILMTFFFSEPIDTQEKKQSITASLRSKPVMSNWLSHWAHPLPLDRWIENCYYIGFGSSFDRYNINRISFYSSNCKNKTNKVEHIALDWRPVASSSRSDTHQRSPYVSVTDVPCCLVSLVGLCGIPGGDPSP